MPVAAAYARSFLVKSGMQFALSLRLSMFAIMLIEDGTKEVLLIPKVYLKSNGQLGMVLTVNNSVVG